MISEIVPFGRRSVWPRPIGRSALARGRRANVQSPGWPVTSESPGSEMLLRTTSPNAEYAGTPLHRVARDDLGDERGGFRERAEEGWVATPDLALDLGERLPTVAELEDGPARLAPGCETGHEAEIGP